jgi:hypothetical protein
MTITAPRPVRRVTTYEPVTIIPARDGWRAVFIGSPGEDPGYAAEPLTGWGIFEVTEKPASGTTGPVYRWGRQIHGIVALEDEVTAAPAAADNFWRYLRPGDELTDEEVTAEQDARNQVWKAGVQ